MPEDIPLRYIDNPLAPDLFAAGPCGYFNLQGVIMIALEAPHVDHETSPGPVNRVVIGRLVMPAAGAYALATGLFNFLKDQGFDVSSGDDANAH